MKQRLAVIAIAFLAACGGGSSPGPGDDDDDDAPPPLPFPHALCSADGPTFPADLGDGCGAGSNQPLCQVDDPSCSTGACLWDLGAPGGGQAYCTAACTVGDASTCPEGWSCQVEGCGDRPVCVQGFVTPAGPAVVTAGAIDNNLFLDEQTFRDAAGRPMWLDVYGRIFRHEASGSFSTFGPVGNQDGNFNDQLFSAAQHGDVLYLSGGYSGSYGWLAKLEHDTITRVEVAERADAIFVTPAGGVVALVGNQLMSVDPVTLATQPLAGASPIPVYHPRSFAGGGFVASCTVDGVGATCLGTDGTDTHAVSPPAPEGTLGRVTGLAANDLWAMDDAGTVFHFDGTTWTTEALPAPVRHSGDTRLVLLSPGKAVRLTDAELLVLDGRCWSRPFGQTVTLPDSEARIVALDDHRLEWIDGRADLVTLALP